MNYLACPCAIFFDSGQYGCIIDGKYAQRSYIKPKKNSHLSFIDRENSMTYNVLIDSQYSSKNSYFIKLAGGIFIFKPEELSERYRESSILALSLGGSYVHQEYDGITHFTIEDSEYIYAFELIGNVDISVKYRENIYLVSYLYKNKHHLRILTKKGDYIELLNVSGDEINILDEGIEVVNKYGDSLGRIRRELYQYAEDRYKRIKCEFSYTYHIVYSKDMLLYLLEDAVFAGDFDYVKSKMNEDIDAKILSEYFDSILGDDFELMHMELMSGDTMCYLVHTKYGYKIENIRVIWADNGLISNFDRGIDGD